MAVTSYVAQKLLTSDVSCPGKIPVLMFGDVSIAKSTFKFWEVSVFHPRLLTCLSTHPCLVQHMSLVYQLVAICFYDFQKQLTDINMNASYL